MQRIEFACPACGRRLAVREDAAGKRGKCPTCSAALAVPSPAEMSGARGARWRRFLPLLLVPVALLCAALLLRFLHQGRSESPSEQQAAAIPRGSLASPDVRRPILVPDDAVRTGLGPAPKAKGEFPPAQLFEAASPAVARLCIRDEDGVDFAYGSGFFVDPQWVYSRQPRRKVVDDALGLLGSSVGYYLLTNYHVVETAANVLVQLADGRTGSVLDVADEDEAADLALLEVSLPLQPGSVEAPAVAPRGSPRARTQEAAAPVPQLRFSGPDLPAVGTTVYAIGSPHGLQNTLSEGIVSGRRSVKGRLWLQTTAPISAGSSGGPLVNPQGEVVGVATFLYEDGQNLNFAVPTPVVVEFLRSPLESREIWQGVSIRDQEDDAITEALYSSAAAHVTTVPELRVEFPDQVRLLVEAHTHLLAREYDAAINSAQQAKRADPGPYEYLVHYVLGKALFRKEYGRAGLTAAVAPLEEATRLNPSFAPPFDLLARIHSMNRDYAKSLVNADRLVALVPRSYKAYWARGEAYQGLNDYRSALQDFTKALSLRPNHPDLYGCLGSAYLSLGELGAAEEAYQAALRCLGEDVGSKGVYEYSLGLVYMKAGRYEDALAAFERALQHGVPADWVRERILFCRSQVGR